MGVTLDTAAEPVAQTILVNIFAPELIILGFLLVLLHSVYLSHILPVLTSKMFTRSEDREDYDRINAELKRLRKEAAPLNGPDTFAQYSLLRRKILVLERNLASIAPRVKSFENTSNTGKIGFLRSVLPIIVLIGVCAWFYSRDLLSIVNTNPDRVYGCWDSITGIFGLSHTLDERFAYFTESLVFCSPLRFLLSGSIGLFVWTLVVSRALNFGLATFAQLRSK